MSSRPLTSGKPSTSLSHFCLEFCSKFGIDSVRAPELLGQEFRKFIGLSGIPRLSDLRKLAPALGIQGISSYKPISSERGSFFKYKEKVEVFYKADDWEGSQEFTVLHEIREIIGAIVKQTFPHFQDAKGEYLETEADAFAAAALMEKARFLEDMEKCGFDPIFLHERYFKSYVAIIARMASVQRGIKGMHFWGSVIERRDNGPLHFFEAACFHRSPRYLPVVRYQVPNSLFPKRGQKVLLAGSLLLAVKNQRSVLIERLTGLDFWDKYCLSLMIRPVIWGRRVAKLILCAVPTQDMWRLRNQIERVSPIIVEQSCQKI